jgi:ribosome-associated heat shock protein Hsp15
MRSNDTTSGRPGRDRNEESQNAADVRLDVWLDVSCLFKTRSEAQKACRGGKVTMNGSAAKPNRLIKAGDELKITRGHGRAQSLRVRSASSVHVPKAEARLLYEDLTPPPTAEEIEQRRLDRIYRAVMTPPRAPDKRERRMLRRLQGKS